MSATTTKVQRCQVLSLEFRQAMAADLRKLAEALERETPSSMGDDLHVRLAIGIMTSMLGRSDEGRRLMLQELGLTMTTYAASSSWRIEPRPEAAG